MNQDNPEETNELQGDIKPIDIFEAREKWRQTQKEREEIYFNVFVTKINLHLVEHLGMFIYEFEVSGHGHLFEKRKLLERLAKVYKNQGWSVQINDPYKDNIFHKYFISINLPQEKKEKESVTYRENAK